MNVRRVSLDIDPGLYELLEAAQRARKSNRVSISWLIRDAIERAYTPTSAPEPAPADNGAELAATAEGGE